MGNVPRHRQALIAQRARALALERLATLNQAQYRALYREAHSEASREDAARMARERAALHVEHVVITTLPEGSVAAAVVRSVVG